MEELGIFLIWSPTAEWRILKSWSAYGSRCVLRFEFYWVLTQRRNVLVQRRRCANVDKNRRRRQQRYPLYSFFLTCFLDFSLSMRFISSCCRNSAVCRLSSVIFSVYAYNIHALWLNGATFSQLLYYLTVYGHRHCKNEEEISSRWSVQVECKGWLFLS